MRNYVLFLIVITVVGTQDAYSTHISVPVLTVDEKLEYSFGEDLIIAGWVEYDGKATSDVLLNFKLSDPNGFLVTESFTTSNSAGRFEFPFGLEEGSVPGDYQVGITSMCREEHRQICTHRTAQATVSVSERLNADIYIPQWVKTVTEFWVNDQIDDASFIRVIEFLIQGDIIAIPGIEEIHAGASLDMPDWIKTNAEFWIAGSISDSEFADAINWLVGNGIIRI